MKVELFGLLVLFHLKQIINIKHTTRYRALRAANGKAFINSITDREAKSVIFVYKKKILIISFHYVTGNEKYVVLQANCQK